MNDINTIQEICDAANKISNYCHDTVCERCIFFGKNIWHCELAPDVPNDWPHFTSVCNRWTATDITLAKALITMGYATATKTMQPDGHPSITVTKIDADGRIFYVDEITRDSFPALEYDEVIKLEDIAGEETSAND